MIRRILVVTAIGLVVAVALGSALFLPDIGRSYERVRGHSQILSSPYGEIEYVVAGSGPAVLVIHGSGGGYDQGQLLSQVVLNEDFQSVIPSRFGYLGSTYYEGATWDDQAHAYAYLLDELGLQRVAVIALSHGGPSALVFSELYPERVSSLTLLSCGVATQESEDQDAANRKGERLTALFNYDFPYWVVSKAFNGRFMELMGADRAVVASLDPEQREWVHRVIDYMNPVSARAAGALFDNRAVLPGERIRSITAPTLVVHATDDRLQLFHNAEFAAANIPGARLMRFDHGGHVVMVVEGEAIRAAVQAHILENAVDCLPDNDTPHEPTSECEIPFF
jgi:2-hydroxy-6-oxonona-2,4-dienedioate hydrolase